MSRSRAGCIHVQRSNDCRSYDGITADPISSSDCRSYNVPYPLPKRIPCDPLSLQTAVKLRLLCTAQRTYNVFRIGISRNKMEKGEREVVSSRQQSFRTSTRIFLSSLYNLIAECFAEITCQDTYYPLE